MQNKAEADAIFRPKKEPPPTIWERLIAWVFGVSVRQQRAYRA